MKKTYVETKNTKRALAAILKLMVEVVGIERLLLIFGLPRMGKTEFIVWAINNIAQFQDAVYIRCIKIMSARWLLELLANGLGHEAVWRSKELFDLCRDSLIGTNRLVIFDEIDYLARDAKIIETIRDLNDLTNAPFVFIGMSTADRKLKRFPHLWGRFSEIVHFEPPDSEDTVSILTQILEVEVDESVIDLVCDTKNLNLSLIYRWGQKIERVARSRGLDKVSADDLFNKREKNVTKTNRGSIKLSA